MNAQVFDDLYVKAKAAQSLIDQRGNVPWPFVGTTWNPEVWRDFEKSATPSAVISLIEILRTHPAPSTQDAFDARRLEFVLKNGVPHYIGCTVGQWFYPEIDSGQLFKTRIEAIDNAIKSTDQAAMRATEAGGVEG